VTLPLRLDKVFERISQIKNKENRTVVNNFREYLQHAEKKMVGKLEIDIYNSSHGI
jgi:hypothetical protein